MNAQIRLIPLLFIACALPLCNIAAAQRATDEQMDSFRKESSLDKLLETPAANCNKVCSLFMTTRNPSLEEAVGKVKLRRAKEGVGAEDAAALAVMYVRGERALKTSIARKKRDSSDLKSLPQLLIPTLVNAYSGLPETYDGKLLNELNREITRLLTERSAGTPDASICKLVEEKYIDSPRRPLDSLAAARVVGIYRRLGLKERLAREFAVAPKEIKDSKALFRTMQLADATEGEFHAVPYAEELLSRLGKTDNVDFTACGNVIARESPAKALELLPSHAEKMSALYIELHTAAKLLKKDVADEKSNYEWLDKYVAKAESRLDGQEDGRIQRLSKYRWAIIMLEQRSDYDAVLYLCMAMDKSAEDTDKANDDYWTIIMSRGRALRKLGMKTEAIAVYSQVRDYEFLSERLRNQARRAITELEK